jgi:hypothetical protein
VLTRSTNSIAVCRTCKSYLVPPLAPLMTCPLFVKHGDDRRRSVHIYEGSAPTSEDRQDVASSTTNDRVNSNTFDMVAQEDDDDDAGGVQLVLDTTQKPTAFKQAGAVATPRTLLPAPQASLGGGGGGGARALNG